MDNVERFVCARESGTKVARGQRPLGGQATWFAARNACSLILRVQQLSWANRLEFYRGCVQLGKNRCLFAIFTVLGLELWNVELDHVLRTEWIIPYGFPVGLERDFKHRIDGIRPGVSRRSSICSPNVKGRATVRETEKFLGQAGVVYTRRGIALVLVQGWWWLDRIFALARRLDVETSVNFDLVRTGVGDHVLRICYVYAVPF